MAKKPTKAVATRVSDDDAHVPSDVQRMVEEIVVAKLHPNKTAVKVVKTERGVALYSSNRAAMQEVARAIQEGGDLTMTKVKDPTPEDVRRLLGDTGLAGLLGPGE